MKCHLHSNAQESGGTGTRASLLQSASSLSAAELWGWIGMGSFHPCPTSREFSSWALHRNSRRLWHCGFFSPRKGVLSTQCESMNGPQSLPIPARLQFHAGAFFRELGCLCFFLLTLFSPALGRFPSAILLMLMCLICKPWYLTNILSLGWLVPTPTPPCPPCP